MASRYRDELALEREPPANQGTPKLGARDRRGQLPFSRLPARVTDAMSQPLLHPNNSLPLVDPVNAATLLVRPHPPS